MKHFILDTYNISALLSRAGPGNRAVYYLVTLIRYFALKHPSYKISLVVDGASPGEFMLPPNAVVIESGISVKADDVIKEMVDLEINKPNCTVVSSDLEVNNYARISSCKALKSDEFLDRLQKNYIDMTGSKPGNIDKPLAATNSEKKKLMNEFNKELDDKTFLDNYKYDKRDKVNRPLSAMDFMEEPPASSKKKQKKREVLHMADKQFSMSEEEMQELLKLFGGEK